MITSFSELDDYCSFSGCTFYYPTAQKTNIYGFSQAVKVTGSAGFEAGASGNLSQVGSYNCSSSAILNTSFIKKSLPKKIDYIKAGFLMAVDIIRSNGGATGSVLELPAAITAILYGFYYDEDIVDDTSVIDRDEIYPDISGTWTLYDSPYCDNIYREDVVTFIMSNKYGGKVFSHKFDTAANYYVFETGTVSFSTSGYYFMGRLNASKDYMDGLELNGVEGCYYAVKDEGQPYDFDGDGSDWNVDCNDANPGINPNISEDIELAVT